MTSRSNVLHVIRILFFLALPLAVCSSGSAASLQGKVTDVLDGETITVLSLKYSVKVKLIGVAAPERDQAYAGVARQHLADFILNKFVVVRFSALRDGYLVGQVFLGEMDICAQMLRDGGAWYKSHEGDLSELDRQIYEASQAAARKERRGLWQDESPVAPWDFHKAPAPQPIGPNSTAVAFSGPPARVTRAGRAGLSSEDLMGGMIRPGSSAIKPDVRQLSTDGAQGRWLRYQPAGGHFSILAPSDGVEVSYKVLAQEGQVRDVRYVVGVNVKSKTIYLVSWVKGPNGTSTNVSTEVDAVAGFLTEVNRVREQYGEVLVTATPGQSLKLSGYEGREYGLATGSASGVIRVFSKEIGTEREVIFLAVLTPPGTAAPGDDGFFNSLTIRAN